jgi:hypothetical protein
MQELTPRRLVMSAAGNKGAIAKAQQPPKSAVLGGAETAPAHFEERHYTVADIAATWSLSADAVRKLFEREPGVIVIGDPAPRGKRRYTTLRIPQSVVERLHRRLRNL